MICSPIFNTELSLLGGSEVCRDAKRRACLVVVEREVLLQELRPHVQLLLALGLGQRARERAHAAHAPVHAPVLAIVHLLVDVLGQRKRLHQVQPLLLQLRFEERHLARAAPSQGAALEGDHGLGKLLQRGEEEVPNLLRSSSCNRNRDRFLVLVLVSTLLCTLSLVPSMTHHLIMP